MTRKNRKPDGLVVGEFDMRYRRSGSWFADAIRSRISAGGPYDNGASFLARAGVGFGPG